MENTVPCRISLCQVVIGEYLTESQLERKTRWRFDPLGGQETLEHHPALTLEPDVHGPAPLQTGPDGEIPAASGLEGQREADLAIGRQGHRRRHGPGSAGQRLALDAAFVGPDPPGSARGHRGADEVGVGPLGRDGGVEPLLSASSRQVEPLEVVHPGDQMLHPDHRPPDPALPGRQRHPWHFCRKVEVREVELGEFALADAAGRERSSPGGQGHPRRLGQPEPGGQSGAAQSGIAAHVGGAPVTIPEGHPDRSGPLGGQDHEAIRSDAVQAKRGFEDYLSSDEWKRITETPAAPRGKQYLLGRNEGEDELDIPTVLRDPQFARERRPGGSYQMAGEKSEA